MEVIIREECGYELALYGLSLSFKDRAIPFEDWWKVDRYTKLKKTAKAMASKDGGHNKFLEAINLWIDIEAPRYWWSEFDTYRVGMSKQSESSMHTILRRDITINDFECGYKSGDDVIKVSIPLINELRKMDVSAKDLVREMKRVLPDSYLQRRLVVTNYKTLRNIILQRHNHKLADWKAFCKAIYKQAEHVELLPKIDKFTEDINNE